MSPFDISVPTLTALRLPGIGVWVQRTSGGELVAHPLERFVPGA